MLEDGDAMVSASFVYSFESISEHWGKYPDWVQHPTVGNYSGLKQIRFYYASNETLAFAVPSTMSWRSRRSSGDSPDDPGSATRGRTFPVPFIEMQTFFPVFHVFQASVERSKVF